VFIKLPLRNVRLLKQFANSSSSSREYWSLPPHRTASSSEVADRLGCTPHHDSLLHVIVCSG